MKSGAGTVTRRSFVLRLVAGGVGSAVGASTLARVARAQQVPQQPAGMDSSNLFAMDQSASRPVRLPPKPGAHPVLTADERDAVEHRIRCQCGCTLDVYTCRTTDFSCQVSPAMHRDIMALAAGGYAAQEILDAFVAVYGERVLMAPPAEGFNLFGWAAPFVALGVGGVVVAVLLRSWRRPPRAAAAPAAPPLAVPSDATPAELARLDAMVRDDG
jgi:cytochrome c-type biogenesis protein CcmH